MSDIGKKIKKELNKSGKMVIHDHDIATVEALHDLLMDAHGYVSSFPTLKRARELTSRMYEAIRS